MDHKLHYLSELPNMIMYRDNNRYTLWIGHVLGRDYNSNWFHFINGKDNNKPSKFVNSCTLYSEKLQQV